MRRHRGKWAGERDARIAVFRYRCATQSLSPGPHTRSFVQDDSFLSEATDRMSPLNLRRDTGTTDRVLLPREFALLGRRGAGSAGGFCGIYA